jgi:hypothetical protein
MAKPSTELRALKNLISEAELILSTTILPENRSKRALELLRAAPALTDDIIGQAKLTPAPLHENLHDRVLIDASRKHR